MVLFYNVAQPQNIKGSYSPFDQVDFLVKIPNGREIKKGSFRIDGVLNISVVRKTQPTASPGEDITKIVPQDGISWNQFCGAHSLFRSFTESVNDQTVENIAYYPRYVAMKQQAERPQTQLYSSSESICEGKGLLLNNVLCGDKDGNVYFSIKPVIALNKSNVNLPQSKFVQMRIMTQLSSGLEAFYSSILDTNGNALINSISYTISDLKLSWYEEMQKSAGDVVLNTCYLNKQTIVSNHTNLNLFAPNVYDSVSVSFIKQKDLNTVLTDNNGCYLIPGIERLEFTLNGNDSPISYPLESYDEYLVNYKKSLNASVKNSFGWKNINNTFGIGCSFPTSVNDKLGINIDINTDVGINASPFDAYMYVNGYLTL